jgi:hypothetical protein
MNTVCSNKNQMSSKMDFLINHIFITLQLQLEGNQATRDMEKQIQFMTGPTVSAK